MAGRVKYELFINGTWRPGSGDAEIALRNPATEETFGSVAVASPADLDEALRSAQESLRNWAATPAAERGSLLVAAAQNLRRELDECAKALTAEQGKTFAEARGEYERAVETLEWYGEHAEELSRPYALDQARIIAPEPIGIVAAFTPWNYPAVLNARKLSAPLAAGCPVILKGAEETPSAGVHIVEALRRAGLPAGVVNLVFGNPPAISEHLLGAPCVRALTFTGSTRVGKQLATRAAQNLQRCVLELGGHSPVVVFEDADLGAAVRAICDYKFECAGQSCNAPSRILVARPVYEIFVRKLVEAAGKIAVGQPDDAATEMGPMANMRRIEAMERLTADALTRGATLETGGNRLGLRGYFWAPTILTNVHPDSVVLHEEPFGPILTVAPFDTIDEAIALANATEYGLASYVFGGSPDVQKTMIGSLAAGAVSLNFLKGVSADAPNAGINQSGYGYEGGEEGIRAFQNLKLVNSLLPIVFANKS